MLGIYLAVVRMELDQSEIERIKTVKQATGMKSTPELFRVLLMEKYQSVTGTTPSKKR